MVILNNIQAASPKSRVGNGNVALRGGGQAILIRGGSGKSSIIVHCDSKPLNPIQFAWQILLDLFCPFLTEQILDTRTSTRTKSVPSLIPQCHTTATWSKWSLLRTFGRDMPWPKPRGACHLHTSLSRMRSDALLTGRLGDLSQRLGRRRLSDQRGKLRWKWRWRNLIVHSRRS